MAEELKRIDREEAELIKKHQKVAKMMREVYSRYRETKRNKVKAQMIKVEDRLLVAAVTA